MDRAALQELSDVSLADCYRWITLGTRGELFARMIPSCCMPGLIHRHSREWSDSHGNFARLSDGLLRSMDFFGARGHGFGITIRMQADADLQETVREFGLGPAIELSGMIAQRGVEPVSPPPGTLVHRVTDEWGAADYCFVVASAFAEQHPDAERVLRTVFAEPANLLAPHVAAFVAYLDAAPVSAAMCLSRSGIAHIEFVGLACGPKVEAWAEP